MHRHVMVICIFTCVLCRLAAIYGPWVVCVHPRATCQFVTSHSHIRPPTRMVACKFVICSDRESTGGSRGYLGPPPKDPKWPIYPPPPPQKRSVVVNFYTFGYFFTDVNIVTSHWCCQIGYFQGSFRLKI